MQWDDGARSASSTAAAAQRAADPAVVSQSAKQGRRHSATSNGMSTPTGERGPAGADGADASSMDTVLRDTSEDGKTRPARRKVMRSNEWLEERGPQPPTNWMASSSGTATTATTAADEDAGGHVAEVGQSGRPSDSARQGSSARSGSFSQNSSHRTRHQQHNLSSNGNPAQTDTSMYSAEQSTPLPHMDIATYPTPALLHALAELLTRITEQNDALRTQREQEQEQLRARSRSQSQLADIAPADRPASSAGALPAGDRSSASALSSAGPIEVESDARHTRSTSVFSNASSSSRGDPVTPAVPLSSPASSQGHGSGSSGQSTEAGRERKKAFLNSLGMTSYPFPDFEERMKKLARHAASVGDDAGTSTFAGQASTSGDSAASGTEQAGVSEDATMMKQDDDDALQQQPGEDAFPLNGENDRAPEQSVQEELRPRSNFSTFRHVHVLDCTSSAVAASVPAARTILTSAANALGTPNATLCFHARNVPSISVESYLVRISKYCPTTNEVFISLLVYFDRMSHLPALASSAGSNAATVNALGTQQMVQAGLPAGDGAAADVSGEGRQGRVDFAVDSFNIHRLIISGITVASKFFSDVFYTNSRYAKVSPSSFPAAGARVA